MSAQREGETNLLATGLRSDVCGALRPRDAGRRVRLAGWVHRRRDHGTLVFIDLRDRYGLVQVVVDASVSPDAHAALSDARVEWVLAVEGSVALRRPGTENEKMPTGAIEVVADSVRVLSQSKTPPFYINEPDAPIDESVRLKHRYLDLRRPIYAKTAAYGHFGREDHDFTWERTDKAAALKSAAKL